MNKWLEERTLVAVLILRDQFSLIKKDNTKQNENAATNNKDPLLKLCIEDLNPAICYICTEFL